MSPSALSRADAESASNSMLALSEQQEGVVERYLSQCLLAVRADPKASRLLRKVKVRSKQRLYNHKVFDLDNTICRLLSSTIKYMVDKSVPYSEQVYPVLKTGTEVAYQQVNPQAEVTSRLAAPTTPQMDTALSDSSPVSRATPRVQDLPAAAVWCGGRAGTHNQSLHQPQAAPIHISHL